MCHRVSPLLRAELDEALDMLRSSGHARVPRRPSDVVVPDAYPGQQLPLFVVNEKGELTVSELTWGFDAPQGSRSKLVFNTRIESALSQANAETGFWSHAIRYGRCLVPVRSFFERWTVNPAQRGVQVRFTMPGHNTFLLAGVWQNDRVSVVTTVPNAAVAPVHTRMPLVLAPGESSLWLSDAYASLADRSYVALETNLEV